MEKEQITILKERGLISISGVDAKDFLQNILTNDVDKVVESNSIFSAILTPQGKYLYEFFIVKSSNGYYLDCDSDFTNEIIENLSKYKLRSKIEIEDLSTEYVVGIISLEKFTEIQSVEKKNTQTILSGESSVFIDPRKKELGARILSNLKNLHLIIKKNNLKIIDEKSYLNKAYNYGIPIRGLRNLIDQLFGLEANLEQLNAIDFKKGCYVGQENTARMKLKNKIRRKLFPVKTQHELQIGSEIFFNDINIGKILINKPYPFGLIKISEPGFSAFKDKELSVEKKKVNIIL